MTVAQARTATVPRHGQPGGGDRPCHQRGADRSGRLGHRGHRRGPPASRARSSTWSAASRVASCAARPPSRACGVTPASGMSIEIQNEYLVARVDGEVRAIAPDIITLLDEQTGEAIHTERLKYGQRLVAVAIPCPPVWRTEIGLRTAGPAAFGFELDVRARREAQPRHRCLARKGCRGRLMSGEHGQSAGARPAPRHRRRWYQHRRGRARPSRHAAGQDEDADLG